MVITEKIIPYKRDWIVQDTYYNCGPASTQTVILGATGKLIPEGTLAGELGTHTGGTDYIGLFPRVLNRYVQGGYAHQDLGSYPTPAQLDQLWGRIKNGIDQNMGTVVNIVAPPSNYPKAVAPSTISPAYAGGTVYHYIAAMGYREDEQGRKVWIADSGFRPFGYWISLQQLGSLITPKGYAYPTVQAPAQPIQPAKTEVAAVSTDQMIKEIWEQLRGITGKGWPQLGKNAKGQDLSVVDAIAAIRHDLADLRTTIEEKIK